MPGLIRSVPTLQFPGTAAAAIAVASSQIGFREGPNNANPFGEWYGMNHVSWCAEFLSWVAAHSGCAAIIPKHAYTPAGAAWFQARGQWGHAPRVGAPAYFYSASQGRIHHVGLVAKVYDDGSFACVEGNTNNNGSAQGNGVYLNRRRSTGGGVGGFGYPKYAKPPAPTKEAPKPPAAARATKFPGAGAFRIGRSDPAVTRLGKRLKALGFDHHHDGDGYQPGPTFSAYDMANLADFQRSRHELASDPDGIPGPLTWAALGL